MRTTVRAPLILALALTAAGCASASTLPPGSSAAHAFAIDGRYRLVFEVARDTLKASDSIEGIGTLSLADGGPRDLGGSGGGLIGFDFDEVGGTRHIVSVFSADCAGYQIEIDKPIKASITKSGAFNPDQPDADFYRSFFADPLVHLPVGDWDVSAVADFIDGLGCGGSTHQLRATVRVHIKP